MRTFEVTVEVVERKTVTVEMDMTAYDRSEVEKAAIAKLGLERWNSKAVNVFETTPVPKGDRQRIHSAMRALRKLGYVAEPGYYEKSRDHFDDKVVAYSKDAFKRAFSPRDENRLRMPVWISWSTGEVTTKMDASEIVAEFEREGLKVTWDGAWHDSIKIEGADY